jgi:hypothetical protein
MQGNNLKCGNGNCDKFTERGRKMKDINKIEMKWLKQVQLGGGGDICKNGK